MTVRKKIIGRQPTDHGPYVQGQSYGQKYQVELYGCVWESKHDNNTTAPATFNGYQIFENTVDWKKVSGSTEAWLLGTDKPATTGESGDYPYNGLGKKILPKNLRPWPSDDDEELRNVLTQDMINEANTIYVIRYDYTLDGNISVPANCVLEFDGGSLSNGTITYNNTFIKGDYASNIRCSCTGTLKNSVINPLMYGARKDENLDSSVAIQAAINTKKKVEFTKGVYVIDNPIVLNGDYYNIDFNFSTLQKTSNTTYNYTYNNVEYQDNAVLIYIPIASPTRGYSLISNVIIDGAGKDSDVNGVISRYSRAVTFNDIRINRCNTGIILGGFLNEYNKITCNDCYLGFSLRGLLYSHFTECFNAVPDGNGLGINIDKCVNIQFNSCASDNATDAAYYCTDSKITLVNCSCEIKSICVFGRNSNITIVGSRFECYQYNSPNPVKYIQLDASKLYAKGTIFHWANYGSLETYENSTQIIATNGSYVSIEGTIEYVEGLKTSSYSDDSIYINGVKAPHASPITLPIKTIGTTAQRPTLNDNDAGFEFCDLTLGIKIFWSGSRWQYSNGFPAIPTKGTTENRPTGTGAQGPLSTSDKGFEYFDTDLKEPIYAEAIYQDGSVTWRRADGTLVIYPQKGTTTQRNAIYTAAVGKGYQYFDTTLGKPVWWDGTNWIDATGATV